MTSNNNIYISVLSKHNPKDKRSHSILRFFAEDLSEEEQIKFVESIFSLNSWVLSSEISKSSNSVKLKEYTEDKFYQIINNWITDRIKHSSYLSKETKNPYLPQQYSIEFREILFTIRNLGFPQKIMNAFNRFIKDCNSQYLKKYFENNFWLLVEEYSTEEIESFFKYFSKIFISEGSVNLSNFIYIFLNNLAYSPKIFDLSSDFTQNLSVLSKDFKNNNYQNNYYHLITVLLLELIEKKKLLLSDPNYNVLINRTLNDLEKGEPDNLELFTFLKRFSYSFDDFDFGIEINSFFERFNENLEKTFTPHEPFKRSIAHHYIKTSKKYFELFLFYLEYLNEKNAIENFTGFFEIVEKLRKSFDSLLWFNEYLNYETITGKILKQTQGGYIIEIDKELLFKKINDHNGFEESLIQNGTGFLSEYSIKEFPELKQKIHSILNKNKKPIKEMFIEDEKFDFFIININYSSTNKGCLITLAPKEKEVYELILKYNLKSFFSSIDIFLIEKANEFLKLKSPFDTKSILLKKIFANKLIDSYKFKISENSFWNILKKTRFDLYESIYISHKKEQEIFENFNVAFKANDTINGLITARTNGGLIVDLLGKTAFLPGSHIDLKPVVDYDCYIGKNIDLKIIKIDPKSSGIVVSHKSILEPRFELHKQELRNNLFKGQVVEGTVKNITTYGVFIDLGGVDGLIHITDITWKRINHPKDVLSLNEKISVIILDFNDDKTKIQLGLKQFEPNPTEVLSRTVKVGDILIGKISQKVEYGFFVEIQNSIEGLLHVSELSWANHESFMDLYSIGESLEVIIKTLDINENRISLSTKNLYNDSWENIEIKYPLASKHMFFIKNINKKGILVKTETGLNGFVEKSDLSWNWKDYNALNEFEVGDKIELMVLNHDFKQKSITLGYKQTFPNPWFQGSHLFSRNTIHHGQILKIYENGFSVKLEKNMIGFVFNDFTKNSNKRIKIGETKYFKVKKFESNNQKLILKMV